MTICGKRLICRSASKYSRGSDVKTETGHLQYQANQKAANEEGHFNTAIPFVVYNNTVYILRTLVQPTFWQQIDLKLQNVYNVKQ